MRECAIIDQARAPREIGLLRWHGDGLRWHFSAQLEPYAGVRRLVATDAYGHALSLGIPAPERGVMRLRRSLSVTQLSWEGFAMEGVLSAVLEEASVSANTSASAGDSPVQWRPAPANMPDALLRDCPTAGLLLRETARTREVAEVFDPRQPMALASHFTRVRVERVAGKRCFVLKL